MLFAFLTASGEMLELHEAEYAARLRMPDNHQLINSFTISNTETGTPLAYVFELSPAGYVITSADTDLPPVIAYASVNPCRLPGSESSALIDLVQSDLTLRSEYLDLPQRQANREHWQTVLQEETDSGQLEQWPPAGSSPTEGWLQENWTQGAPYNMYCPMDLIAGSRSVAGCPAVAMGSILNFHECTNGTRYDDNDDYYHNYHEYYWIDDDHETHDFPSWPELNILLDTLETHYASGHITDSDRGAIVYASGAACKQVYTASVSGTFGVEQAYAAYLRFGFADSELLFESSDDLLQRMTQNMMDAMPIHLAIIDEVPQYGHNVVVDGYNSDEFFHINFGWGGSSNGWYSFPLTGMPYGMNIIEGVVLDIGEPAQSAQDDQDFTAGIQISLVSNPVSSTASLTVSVTETTPGTLTVYSVDGRVVNSQSSIFPEGASQQLIPGLSPGIYLVKVTDGLNEAAVRLTVLQR